MINQKKILTYSSRIFFIGFFLVSIFNLSPVFATDVSVQLQIPIAGKTSFTVCHAGIQLLCTGIGEYITVIYQWAIGFAAVLAIIALTYGGVLWMTAGGGKRTDDAKKVITNAIAGLILALCSYLLLAAINPDLVSFRPISITSITQIILNLDEPEADDPLSFSGAGTTYTSLPHLEVNPQVKADLEDPGVVDPKMVGFLNKLDKIAEATGIRYHLSILNRGHSIHTKCSKPNPEDCNKSQHKFGTGVDITYKLPQDDPKLIELAQKLIDSYKSNPDELGIRQLIFSSPSTTELINGKVGPPSMYPAGTLNGHKNHIHVGVDSAGTFHSFPGDPL